MIAYPQSLIGPARTLRAGFTRIELLVVIAIIAILIGMLHPAGDINNGVCYRGQLNPSSKNTGQNAFPAPCLVLGLSHLNNPDGDIDASVDDYSRLHPGGGNILFADGSIHFVRTIPHNNPDGSYPPDSLTFQAMGTRANGEVILDWLDD